MRFRSRAAVAWRVGAPWRAVAIRTAARARPAGLAANAEARPCRRAGPQSTFTSARTSDTRFASFEPVLSSRPQTAQTRPGRSFDRHGWGADYLGYTGAVPASNKVSNAVLLSRRWQISRCCTRARSDKTAHHRYATNGDPAEGCGRCSCQRESRCAWQRLETKKGRMPQRHPPNASPSGGREVTRAGFRRDHSIPPRTAGRKGGTPGGNVAYSPASIWRGASTVPIGMVRGFIRSGMLR